MDPFLEGSKGQNHIDARLGCQCYYGVLDPLFGTPILGVPRSGVWGLGPQIWGLGPPAPDPNPRYPFGGITGHSFLVTCDPTEWVTRMWGTPLTGCAMHMGCTALTGCALYMHSPYGLCTVLHRAYGPLGRRPRGHNTIKGLSNPRYMLPRSAHPYNARARNVRACPRARARGMNPRWSIGSLF